MNSNGFNIKRYLIQQIRKQTRVKRAQGDSVGYSLSRKSAAMGSDISMWDDSSLYTSPCSRSGRKFKIFWSTISDWCEKGSQTMVSLSCGMSHTIMLQQKSKTGDLIVVIVFSDGVSLKPAVVINVIYLIARKEIRSLN